MSALPPKAWDATRILQCSIRLLIGGRETEGGFNASADSCTFYAAWLRDRVWRSRRHFSPSSRRSSPTQGFLVATTYHQVVRGTAKVINCLLELVQDSVSVIAVTLIRIE